MKADRGGMWIIEDDASVDDRVDATKGTIFDTELQFPSNDTSTDAHSSQSD
jgi:hypothetical protein